MKSKILKTAAAFSVAAAGILWSAPAFAVSVKIARPVSLNVGDTVLVPVSVDTEGKTVNAIDGSVAISGFGAVDVRDISLAGSRVPMWVRTPSLSPAGDSVSFVAAFPGGISGDSVQMFTLALHAGKQSTVELVPKDLKGYLNDGLGTEVPSTGPSPRITVGPASASPVDELRKSVSSDNIPPLAFPVEVLQTRELYGGRKYLSYRTADEQTGIDRYEVSEGDGPWIRTGGEYVLSKQSGYQKVKIRAVDRAGNVRVVEFSVGSRIRWWAVVAGSAVGYLVLRLAIAAVIALRKKYAFHKKN